jgi:hypothetical protein
MTDVDATGWNRFEGPWSTSFWSYVHDDDSRLFGRIDQLRLDLMGVYHALTGQKLRIFVDRESIGLGEQWTNALQRGVQRATFMMPVVTANYFTSDWCRTELLTFFAICEARGTTDLILPIIFTGHDRISIDSDDEVSRIIAGSQGVDFSEIWPYERGGERWAVAVRDLATKIRAAELRVEDQLSAILTASVPVPDRPASGTGDDRDAPPDEHHDQPGLVDHLDDFRARLDEVRADARDVTNQFIRLSRTMRNQVERLHGSADDPGAFQISLAAAAAALGELGTVFESSASKLLRSVSDSDVVAAQIRQISGRFNDPRIAQVLHQKLGPALADWREIRDAEQLLAGFMAQVSDAERLSAALRKELRPIRRGAQFMRDASRTIATWEERPVGPT